MVHLKVKIYLKPCKIANCFSCASPRRRSPFFTIDRETIYGLGRIGGLGFSAGSLDPVLSTSSTLSINFIEGLWVIQRIEPEQFPGQLDLGFN